MSTLILGHVPAQYCEIEFILDLDSPFFTVLFFKRSQRTVHDLQLGQESALSFSVIGS